MKPNDKAIEAGVKLCWDCPRATPSMIRDILTAAYAAQFPPSDDYAGLVKWLRNKAESLSEIYPPEAEAADALEAVLAERDALKAELAKAQEIARVQAESIGGYIKTIENRDAERDALKADLASARDMTWFWEIVDANGLNNVASSEKDALRKLVRDSAILDGLKAQFGNVGERDGKFTLNSTFQALLDVIDLNVETSHEKIAAIEERDAAIKERDALLARLAPVDDEALVEIVAVYCYPEMNWNEMSEKWKNSCRRDARAAIAAIRPHIEAAERERCAKIAEGSFLFDVETWLNSTKKEMTTHLGNAIAAAIRSEK